MSRTQNVIIGAYITAIVAVFLVYPLVVMHGYHTWWVVLFYAIFVGAAIGGSISHYLSRGQRGARVSRSG
jgi:hypothetical protein